jgi:hypothetical protein
VETSKTQKCFDIFTYQNKGQDGPVPLGVNSLGTDRRQCNGEVKKCSNGFEILYSFVAIDKGRLD